MINGNISYQTIQEVIKKERSGVITSQKQRSGMIKHFDENILESDNVVLISFTYYTQENLALFSRRLD